MTDLDLDATLAAGEQMCRIFTVGPRGTSWRIDDVSVRAVQAALPALVAALREARDLLNAKQAWIDGAKVDLDGYADDQAEYEVAVRAITAERDDLRRRYDALRDGVLGLCDEWERDGSDPWYWTEATGPLRTVVARAEES